MGVVPFGCVDAWFWSVGGRELVYKVSWKERENGKEEGVLALIPRVKIIHLPFVALYDSLYKFKLHEGVCVE